MNKTIFNQDQINISVLLILDKEISSKLQLIRCREKFVELIQIVKSHNTNPNTKEIIKLIENNAKNLSNIRNDTALYKQINAYRFLLK